MFRIRPIYDTTVPIDAQRVEQVQAILAERFPLIAASEVASLPATLKNPLGKGYRTIVFVAEGQRRVVQGFALLCHFSDLRFCYLDYLSVSLRHGGRGVGSALYERVREEARALGDTALFFECLPDDPALCRDPELLRENVARLRFYERYGARPVVNTAYETPLSPEDDCAPYLVADPLDKPFRLTRDRARHVIRAVLERKYKGKCSPEYVRMVLDSIPPGPLALRDFRYARETVPVRPQVISADRRIALVCNEKHSIHHVRERGYVESPVRMSTILREIEKSGLFDRREARHFSERHITQVHDRQFVSYFKTVCAALPEKKSVYPYVFPIRNATRPPKELAVRAGYYCIDTFTPLNGNAYAAARGAVDCGLTAAEEILAGRRLAYALVRPPGHHAERRAFGGFCYFNTAAVVAQRLCAHGRVAVLDVDYHHGNGTQNIFYERGDVLTVSIHGHPSFAYPYFSGFADEIGEGPGYGFNRNYALPEKMDGERYAEVLRRALAFIADFDPAFLVVGLGLDPAKGDPTGTWDLQARDFLRNGKLIGGLGRHTLVVQEGGYRIRSLGVNAANFFQGLFEGAAVARRR
ncbi:GNAT family N-acetyltransferase [Desulfomicrobium escambiense]|uniref:GNAT family N-acetyltransferase n=1 Tax=Desulfomicrobium escambiense TaxID=29503 RepID=UPI0003F75F78|nr:GNAT family N-acetyltransferase [Desulfomicrobium escambiense]